MQEFMSISLNSKVIGSKVSNANEHGGGRGDGGAAGKTIVDPMLF